MAKVVFVVDEGFEDSEFQVPFDRLKHAGHEIEVMGIHPGSEVEGKRGQSFAHIDIAAQTAFPDHYDAMVIPGGHSPDHLRTHQDIVNFVQGFMHTGKPVAAVCHGPQLLIEAESVRGRTLTSWPSVRTDLTNAGASWIDEEVVIDGNLITSRKPQDLEAFCGALEDALRHPPAHRSHVEQTRNTGAQRSSPVKLDEDGFLENPADWDERVALRLAKQEGLDEMSEARWQVIYALREFYQAHHHVPDFHHLCAKAQQEDDFCMERLFNNDGSKAWRIAGLPNPGEEFKAYL